MIVLIVIFLFNMIFINRKMKKNTEQKIRIDDYPNTDKSVENQITKTLVPILNDRNQTITLANIFEIPVNDVKPNLLHYIGYIGSRLWTDNPGIQFTLNKLRDMKNINELLGFYCIAYRLNFQDLDPINGICNAINNMRHIIDQMATYYAIDYMMKIDINTILDKDIDDSNYYMYYKYESYSDNSNNVPILQRQVYKDLQGETVKMIIASQNYQKYAENMRNQRFSIFNTGVTFFSGLEEALNIVYRAGKYNNIKPSNKITNMMQTIKCVNNNPCQGIIVSLKNNCFNCYHHFSLLTQLRNANFKRDRVNNQLRDWIRGTQIEYFREFMEEIFKNNDHDRDLFIKFINVRKNDFKMFFPELYSVLKHIDDRNHILREIFEKYYSS